MQHSGAKTKHKPPEQPCNGFPKSVFLRSLSVIASRCRDLHSAEIRGPTPHQAQIIAGDLRRG